MSHAAEGLLQAYMDGEVTGAAAAELDRHLVACAECEAELRRMRAASSLFHGAVAAIEPAAEAQSAQQAYWRARAAAGRRRTFGAAALARAAGVLLVLAGGVLAVVPGSPLRRAGERLLGREEAPAAAPVSAPAVEAPAAPAEAEMPGITLVPSEGRVQLRVWAASPEATIRVNLVDGVRVSVQAGGDAAGDVSFRSGPGRVEVMNLRNADVSIQIPRSLPFASLEVDGRQWLFKDGDQLRLNGPVAQQSQDVVVFRARN